VIGKKNTYLIVHCSGLLHLSDWQKSEVNSTSFGCRKRAPEYVPMQNVTAFHLAALRLCELHFILLPKQVTWILCLFKQLFTQLLQDGTKMVKNIDSQNGHQKT
jgi:hypothetical protein